MGYSHWVAYPSVKPEKAFACAAKWMAKGFRVLVLFDHGKHPTFDQIPAGVETMVGPIAWPGYYGVANSVAREAFARGADVCTMIGDDMEPPAQGAKAVADAYFSRFPDGYGVMQGCGDQQGMDATGTPAAARICGSPTFGKVWSSDGYPGVGAFWPEYRSFYGDEDLWNVAKAKGLLWLNPEFTVLHKHWSFGHENAEEYQKRNSSAHWNLDKALFAQRKASGFK